MRTNSERKKGAANNAMESPEFYEELLLLRAQEIVSELMEERGINKAQLAKKLGTSKAYVTGMLSTGRNLTLKTLARVCYNLSAEVVLDRKDIGLTQSSSTYDCDFTYHDQMSAIPEGMAAQLTVH